MCCVQEEVCDVNKINNGELKKQELKRVEFELSGIDSYQQTTLSTVIDVILSLVESEKIIMSHGSAFGL